jgi:hypothetical protein
LINLLPRCGLQCAQALYQPSLVYGSDLVKEDNRVFADPTFGRPYKYLGGIQALIKLRGNRRDDCYRAVTVRDVVLDNKRGPCLFDLCSNRGIKVDKIQVAAAPKSGMFEK